MNTVNRTHQSVQGSVILAASVASVGIMAVYIAMQITDEVNWTLSDFIFGWMFLFIGVTAVSLAYKKSSPKRMVIAAVITLLLVLMWAELAVGLFGTPFAGN